MGAREKASTRLGNDSTQGLWGHILGADSAQEGGNDPQTVWPTWLRLPTTHVPGVVPGVAMSEGVAQAAHYLDTQYTWFQNYKKRGKSPRP